MSKNDRAADLRLQRIFNITLAEYNAKLKEQGGGCAICGRFPKSIRLAVDHNHKTEKTKVMISLDAKTRRYTASALDYAFTSAVKSEAVRMVKLYLLRKSVRGLLCMICNRKVLGSIERFSVKPKDVIKYLQKHDPTNPLL